VKSISDYNVKTVRVLCRVQGLTRIGWHINYHMKDILLVECNWMVYCRTQKLRLLLTLNGHSWKAEEIFFTWRHNLVWVMRSNKNIKMCRICRREPFEWIQSVRSDNMGEIRSYSFDPLVLNGINCHSKLIELELINQVFYS